MAGHRFSFAHAGCCTSLKWTYCKSCFNFVQISSLGGILITAFGSHHHYSLHTINLRTVKINMKSKTSHFGQISVNFPFMLIPSISWTMSTVELPRRPGYIACGYQLNLSSGIVFRSSRTRPYPIFLTMTPGRRSNGQKIVVGLPPPQFPEFDFQRIRSWN